jgi:hypothetical protein
MSDDSMPEQGRQAAFVLLDALSGREPGGPDAGNEAVMNLALRRLNEVGAVTATMDDETEEVTVDVSNLVGGTLVTLQWLVSALAERRGCDETVVVHDLRGFLSDNA